MFSRQMFLRKTVLTLVCLLPATSGWSKVLLRWTQPSIPPSATMGIKELVVPWDAEALIKNAHKQGYRVYAEIPFAQAPDAARINIKNLAGIILDPGDSKPSQVDETLGQLQSSYPKLPVLLVNAKAKPPQMKGQLVIQQNGVLQVTSPTAQPWIDSNLALVRLDQAFRPAQTPLYQFQWDLSDPLRQEQGPEAPDYLLAVAEAGAFHADLILDLHPKLQTDLLQNNPAARTVLNQIKRYLAFSSRAAASVGEPQANVGVITDANRNSYEPVNLFARHNIPFAVLQPSGLKRHSLDAFDLLLVFATPDERTIAAIADFASRGGVAVLVGAHGSYPWQSTQPVPAGEHSVSYASGKGRIIELPGRVIDPETFARDVRRLIEKGKVLISLWNALTTVAVPYGVPGGRGKVVEFVNYSQEPLRIQVQLKGSFSSVLYETPEKGCCESLTPVQRGGFTEFVVPSLRIAGRVHVAGGMPAPDKTKTGLAWRSLEGRNSFPLSLPFHNRDVAIDRGGVKALHQAARLRPLYLEPVDLLARP